MTPPIVFASATLALALAIIAGIPWPSRRTLQHPAIIGAGALFVLSVIARALFVQPTLVHADIVAPEVVDCILQFPSTCMTRGWSYGQYGFLFVGSLTRLLGRDLSAVFRAMEIVGALDIVLLAILAYRLSGSPYAALLAVAVTGTNPIFMRVAASEDMHNAGLCLGLVAFIAMDAFVVSRRTLALVAAALALSLMVHTRQTFHVFVPSVFLLGFARGGRDLLKSAKFWGAGVVVIAVLLAREADSAGSGHLVDNMMGIFAEPVLLQDVLRYHALFDVARFGILPVLTVGAVIWACFAGRVARATAIVFAANFVLTYPCGMPSQGIEFAQRISVVAFGMLLVAMAGASLLETRVDALHRALTGLVAAGALALLPPLFPGWRILSTITPIHREYLAVESAAAALPREFTLVKVHTAAAAAQGDARYAGLLARAGKSVHVASADELERMPRPWLFLDNVECWTYSFREITGVKNETAERDNYQVRWDHVLFGHQRSPVRPPEGPRGECLRFLDKDALIGPGRVIADPDDDPPFLFYSSNVVPIQFHEVRPSPAK